MPTASRCPPAPGPCSARASSASRPTATVPADVEGQAALCFAAIAAILAEAGMGLGDLVRLNAYVTAREHLAGYMAARDRACERRRRPRP